MKFQKLKLIELLFGLILIALGYIYIRVDQFFIPEKYRFFAFCIFILIELFGYFLFINPKQPLRLSNSISLFVGIISLLLIMIQHIIIKFDISVKSLFVFLIVIGTPYITGFSYYIFSLKNRKK